MSTTTSLSTDVTPEERARVRRAVVASSVGNALEWFDIIVYASFAVVISKLFFPTQQGFTGLLLTFGTFAISYLIRPIGAMVIGAYGDRAGRKQALSLTIFAMMLGTGIMALAPTAASIGAWAGVVLLASRLLQGFSAGGEFGTATAFLIENAPGRRAFYASWQVATQGAAMFLASAFGFGLNTWLTQDQLESWGWRVPFFFGLLVGPVGLYIRMRMDETPEFLRAEKVRSPLWQTLSQHTAQLLTTAAVVGLASISVYLILFMPTFAVKSLGLPGYAGYLGGMISGLVTLVGVPFVGTLADRVGPAPVMRATAVAAIVLPWPLFKVLLDHPSVATLTVVQIVLGVLMAFYFGPLPALMSDLFPVSLRSTGLSVSYNLGVTLFGGFAPLILAWLVDRTGSLYAPSYYYMAVAVVSLTGLLIVRAKGWLPVRQPA